MHFIVSGATDVGLRKMTNQDSFCARIYNTWQGEVAFAVLCDGMGGLSKGEVASAEVVRSFCEWTEKILPDLLKTGISDYAIRKSWETLCRECNERIKHYAKTCGIKMGTTVTAMLLAGQRYYVVNVGDTRAYEIGEQIHVLTKDQTVVARELRLGRMKPEEAETDKRQHILLQCIGASEEVYPDFFFGRTKCNEVYMLCSDGFRHKITETEIHEFFNPVVMKNVVCMRKNIEALIEKNKQRQEADNISVITIRTFERK